MIRVKEFIKKAIGAVFAMVLIITSAVGVSLLSNTDANAASGTYYVECDNNSGNEYIMYYWESGTEWTRWQDHVILRMKIKGGHYETITHEGGQINCRDYNNEYNAFSSADSAVKFIRWAETDSKHEKSEWVTDSKNGDSSTLYWLYLASFDSNNYPVGTIPSTENQWAMISMVTCRWASPSVADFKHLVEYYNKNGDLVATDKNNNGHSDCSSVFKKDIQTATSPSKNWSRRDSPDSSTLTYIYNPNGWTNAWGARKDISPSVTECKLSANPQLDGAVTTCRVSISGDALVNAYSYGTWSGINIVRAGTNTFDLTADSGTIKEVGDKVVVMFWRAGSKMPTMGESYYTVGKDLVKVTVERVENPNQGGMGDWHIKDPIYYSNCGWGGSSNDYCIELTGDGLKRPDGSTHIVFVSAVSSNDSGVSWSWKETSKKLSVKVSDYITSRLELRFCLDNADGEASEDCRSVIIGGGNAVVMPDPGTNECPEGYALQTDGTCLPNSGESLSGNGDQPKTCFDGGGALGWILCPLLDGLGKMATDTYEGIVEPFLAIDAKLISAQEGAGTYEAWKLFQSIANIVFVILLLIVIFSQLTGIGIDNYGVKKILPKLIVAAILINLSFIICQLLVDVSNIVGYGAKNLFDRVISNYNVIDSITEIASGGEIIPVQAPVSGSAGVFTLVVGAIATTGLLLSQGWAIIIPVLLALLSATISLIFTFVLLGVRQAGVVILVAISPIAFVCYMLPNTKSLFDKWLKMFQGLLLLFPICGLLIGGGNLASRIILDSGQVNFWVALVAMLLNVIPFLFIPTLLKSSFAAMGNIGNKISGISKGTRGWVRGKAQPSLERSRFGQSLLRYKKNREYQIGERNKYAQEQYQYKKSQKRLGKYTGKIRAGEQLSTRETREAATAARIVSGGDAQALDDAKIMIMKTTSNGADTVAVKTQFQSAISQGDVTKARAVAEIMGGQKFTAKDFGDWMEDDAIKNNMSRLDSGTQAKMFEGIAKTMTTGSGAKNYRSANAFRFQHASDILSGHAQGAYDSSAWANQKRDPDDPNSVSNAEFAAMNHITNPNELYAQSSSVLRMLATANLSDSARQDIGELARRSHAAAESGQIEGDRTKDGLVIQLSQMATAQPTGGAGSQGISNDPAVLNVRPTSQPRPQTPPTQGSASGTGGTQDTVIRTGPDAGKRRTPGGIIY